MLFLDEFPEFNAQSVEMLRQPLEDRTILLSRVNGSVKYPASFMLVAASNPCPCGYAGDPVKACTCSPAMITRYGKRISGPVLDRIDIQVEVPRVEYEKLTDGWGSGRRSFAGGWRRRGEDSSAGSRAAG